MFARRWSNGFRRLNGGWEMTWADAYPSMPKSVSARLPRFVSWRLLMRDAGPFDNAPLPDFQDPAGPAPTPPHRAERPAVDPRRVPDELDPTSPFSSSPPGLLFQEPSADRAIEDIHPRLRLLAAAVCIPVAAALLFPLGAWYWHLLGWGLAIFGSLGFISWFTTADLRDQSTNRYRANDTAVAILRITATAMGLLVAGGHAWQLATWVARLDVFA